MTILAARFGHISTVWTTIGRPKIGDITAMDLLGMVPVFASKFGQAGQWDCSSGYKVICLGEECPLSLCCFSSNIWHSRRARSLETLRLAEVLVVLAFFVYILSFAIKASNLYLSALLCDG